MIKLTKTKIDTAKPLQNEYDLIIVGANIIGAGIAREASLRGLKTILINMEDFATGCNANPGELIFGVDRFFCNSNLGMTFEESRERTVLKKIAPQIINEIPFIIPECKCQKRKCHCRKNPLVSFYNYVFGTNKKEEEIVKLKSADLEKKLPGIDSETFKSGILYYDCNVNDYRLTLHNILDSVDNHGEQLNYWFVDKIQKLASKGVRVTAIDQLTGEKIVIKGSVLVNTTGPYSNINLKNWGLHKLEDVKMMKSIHFFLPNINEEYGIVIPTDYHDRIVYAVPMDNNTTMVGITDYQEVNSVECPHVNTAEIQFALDHLNMLFPKLKLSIDQVFAPMAGIKSYLPGNQHKIIVNDFGKSKVISVVGGKMLLYRQIAKEVVDKAVKYIDKKAGSSVSDEIRLRGSQYAELTFKSFVEHRLVSNFILQQLPLDISMNLLRTYGTQINKFDFFPYLEKENGKERIFSGTKSIWAELYYCQDHEFVRKPSDFALHRTFLYLDLVQNPKQIPPFFQKAGEILKLTPQQIKEDQQEFLDTFKII